MQQNCCKSYCLRELCPVTLNPRSSASHVDDVSDNPVKHYGAATQCSNRACNDHRRVGQQMEKTQKREQAIWGTMDTDTGIVQLMAYHRYGRSKGAGVHKLRVRATSYSNSFEHRAFVFYCVWRVSCQNVESFFSCHLTFLLWCRSNVLRLLSVLLLPRVHFEVWLK